MAKIGLLYLKEGQWDGMQVVPAEWVAVSTRKHIDATLQDGYGYQWWTTNQGIYMALGYAGQFIFVSPDENLVVTFTSHLEEQDFYIPQQLMGKYILPAVKSNTALSENHSGQTRLRESLQKLSQP